MRVLLLNTSEKVGGAAIACRRLMEALNHHGVKAKMLVRNKQTDHLSVSEVTPRWLLSLKFVWERLVILLNNGFRYHDVFQVDIANTGTDITRTPEFREADVIHLHWVNQGYLSLRDLRAIMHSGKRIVVTLHDQWYFTGICHYSSECDRYTSQCHDCPQCHGPFLDLARRTFDTKRSIYSDARITFVGCSRWMADLARQSALTKGHQVISIPNAIPTDLFCPSDKASARQHRSLPADRRLILFNAQRITDSRKGFDYFAEACRILCQSQPQLASTLAVVVLGGDSAQASSLLPLPVYAIPYISNVSDMIDTYNSVDLFVTPSLQDNLPNTIVEAMSCGIPCVGFHVGGIPEMIDHQVNGYVATYRDADDLAQGISWTLDSSRHSSLAQAARRKAVDTYSEQSVARKYIEAYDHTRLSNL